MVHEKSSTLKIRGTVLARVPCCRQAEASLTVGLVGPQNTATERMDGRSAYKSKGTDVYSMGVTLGELFTVVPPNHDDRLDQVQLVRERNVRYRLVSDDPEEQPSATVALADIGRIRETSDYKECPPLRMEKGKLDGVENVTFTDRMC